MALAITVVAGLASNLPKTVMAPQSAGGAAPASEALPGTTTSTLACHQPTLTPLMQPLALFQPLPSLVTLRLAQA